MNDMLIATILLITVLVICIIPVVLALWYDGNYKKLWSGFGSFMNRSFQAESFEEQLTKNINIPAKELFKPDVIETSMIDTIKQKILSVISNGFKFFKPRESPYKIHPEPKPPAYMNPNPKKFDLLEEMRNKSNERHKQTEDELQPQYKQHHSPFSQQLHYPGSPFHREGDD